LNGFEGRKPSDRTRKLFWKNRKPFQQLVLVILHKKITFKLVNCYRNALLLADKHQVKSNDFPAISTGIFGFPKEKAAEIALPSIKSSIPSLQTIRTIGMVLFDRADLVIFEEKLGQLIE